MLSLNLSYGDDTLRNNNTNNKTQLLKINLSRLIALAITGANYSI